MIVMKTYTTTYFVLILSIGDNAAPKCGIGEVPPYFSVNTDVETSPDMVHVMTRREADVHDSTGGASTQGFGIFGVHMRTLGMREVVESTEYIVCRVNLPYLRYLNQREKRLTS
jgi:hypothetical protein